VVHTRFSKSDYEEGLNETEGTYIVCQKEPFLLDKDLDIYAKVIDRKETNEDANRVKIMHYELQLYSYRTPLSQMKEFVSTITSQYRDKISNSRKNKRFMYTLINPTYTDASEKYTCWRENEFHSSKTFDNVFFENKDAIVDKIKFFMENKEWYDTYGIPYTLGIGIYGPPGTGKTSFIKALMNLTKNRHLINIPISIIQTKRQLTEFYFETRFTEWNEPNSMTFDRKIIVIEDIDCVGDIVLERKHESPAREKHPRVDDSDDDIPLNEKLNWMDDDIKETIKQTIAKEREKYMDGFANAGPKREERITLDDILNLWDGIIETPGRILIITSNHYDKLDSALRRPGRIDITIPMNRASRDIIAEMYQYFYRKDMERNRLAGVQEGFYSSAEIVNLYTLYPSDPDGFLSRLEENTHV
jgi:chaperone BCS1